GFGPAARFVVGPRAGVAEEDGLRAGLHVALAAEDALGEGLQSTGEGRVGGEELLVLQVQRLQRRLVALVSLVEVAQRVVVVVRGEELLALDAERLADAESLVGDLAVERQ